MPREDTLYGPVDGGGARVAAPPSSFQTYAPASTGAAMEEQMPGEAEGYSSGQAAGSGVAFGRTVTDPNVLGGVTESGEPTYVRLTDYALRLELAETKARLVELERLVGAMRYGQELTSVQAGLAEIGLFLLHKVGTAADGIPVDVLADSLEAPSGWLAFARLMRAGLVDENGRCVYITGEGERVLAEMDTLKGPTT